MQYLVDFVGDNYCMTFECFNFILILFFCSCLTTAPHFKKALESTTSVRKPLTNHNPLTGSTITDAGLVKPGATPTAGLFIDKMQSSEGMYYTYNYYMYLKGSGCC